MIIKIKRHRITSEVIDGSLTIDGSIRLCDTAENAHSALPAGQYKVSIIKCKQHARKMPVVLLVPEHVEGPNCDHCDKLEFVSNNTKMPCLCPMLKPGNGVYHREDGSIIVGEYIAPGCLKHPKEAFTTIYDRIRKSAERGHDLTLIIEEHYPIARRELTNFELGQQILQQMGGRKTAIEHSTPLKPSNR